MFRRSQLEAILLILPILALVPSIASAAGQAQEAAGYVATHAASRAVAVSGPIISISPGSHNFGRVNVGTSAGSFDFTVSNTGDADLHVSGAVESNPGSGFTATIPGTITPGGTGLLTVAWTSTGSGFVTDNFSVQSDAANGPYVILALGKANNAPQFTPPLLATYLADAFVPFSLTASADDPEGDVLDWSLASTPQLPVGASLDHTNGAFTWTPDPVDAGSYAVTISVTDGVATTPGPFTLQVRSRNSPPVANPGGPYHGFTNLPLQFDGTASSDPDAGQTLTYAWDLGDGTSATGPLPLHTYDRPNVYVVGLTVTDSDVLHLQNTAFTAAEILDFIEAKIVQSLTKSNVIRTTGNGEQQFGLWMLLRAVTDVDPSTIRMSTTFIHAGTVSEIKIDDKRLKVGDLDGDMFRDLDFTFRTSDIRALLAHVPNGTTVTLLITAKTLSDGVPIRGAIDMVKQGPATIAATASPNPLNPETTISYSVAAGGMISVRIFSVSGQLIRVLSEEPATAGMYRVRWNGFDDGGRRVPSGIYFVRVEQNGESSISKLSVLR
jgi:PKD repeat protein